MSYYFIERVTTVDHAGTALNECFFTTSRELLGREIRGAIMRPGGGFDTDVLELAWLATIEKNDSKALEYFLGSYLTIVGGEFWRRELVPDTTIVRDDLTVEISVDHEKLLAAHGRRRKLAVFKQGDETFNTLGALGTANFLNALRSAEGPIKILFDLGSMLDSIPNLAEPKLDSPLRFLPFFESKEFLDVWEDEGVYADLGLPEGETWDGLIPLDTWCSLESPDEMCAELGIAPKIAP